LRQQRALWAVAGLALRIEMSSRQSEVQLVVLWPTKGTGAKRIDRMATIAGSIIRSMLQLVGMRLLMTVATICVFGL